MLFRSQRGHRELRVLRNERNRGKGYSIRRAYAECAGTHVLFTDADLPYGLDSLEASLAALEGGADLVIGSRVLPGSMVRMSSQHFPYILARHLLGRAMLRAVNLMFGLDVSDTQCGFKACRSLAPRCSSTSEQITASYVAANRHERTSPELNSPSGTRARHHATRAGSRSTPVTVHPRSASIRHSTPEPQPTSSTRAGVGMSCASESIRRL